MRLWLEGPAALSLLEVEVALAPGEVRRLFSLGELWESPLEAQARFLPVQEALAQLPPGAYRLVGEAWEGERLWSRHVLEPIPLAVEPFPPFTWRGPWIPFHRGPHGDEVPVGWYHLPGAPPAPGGGLVGEGVLGRRLG